MGPYKFGPPLHNSPSGALTVRDFMGKWIATVSTMEVGQILIDGLNTADKKQKAAEQERWLDQRMVTEDWKYDKVLCRVCLQWKSGTGIGQHCKDKHGMKLMAMYNLKVPTNREYQAIKGKI